MFYSGAFAGIEHQEVSFFAGLSNFSIFVTDAGSIRKLATSHNHDVHFRSNSFKETILVKM